MRRRSVGGAGDRIHLVHLDEPVSGACEDVLVTQSQGTHGTVVTHQATLVHESGRRRVKSMIQR